MDLEREEKHQAQIKKRKQEIIIHCSMVAVGVLIFLGVVTLFWKAVGNKTPNASVQTVAQSQGEEQVKQESVEATQELEVTQQAEDTTNTESAETSTEILASQALSSEEQEKIESEILSFSEAAKTVEQSPYFQNSVAEQAVSEVQTTTYPVPGWQVNDNGWWYETSDGVCYANGWFYINGRQYYFNREGYMVTGWNYVNGDDYYFNEGGEYQPEVRPKQIAMTFDDGPSGNTDRLLDVLVANNAKATFFMVGTQIETYPETVQKMASLGMELGNHTWDHTYLNQSTPAEMYEKFSMVDQKLMELTGQEASVYRSPGGGESDEYRAGISRPLILWNVDTLDWKNKDVAMNIDAVLSNADDGDIILMHDLYEATVTACETIIPELRARGFQLLTVEELAASKGETLQAGVDYFSFASEYEDKTYGSEE